MPKTTYTPPADSLASSVVSYFRNNPEEQLTVEDISEKFSVGLSSVHTQLSLVLDAKLLHRSQDQDGQYVYAAGTTLAIDYGWKQTSLAKQAKRVQAPNHDAFDFAAVKIESGVPVPQRSIGKTLQLRKLLFKLSESESCVLPMNTRTILARVITKEQATTSRRYIAKKIAADQIRLWRTA